MGKSNLTTTLIMTNCIRIKRKFVNKMLKFNVETVNIKETLALWSFLNSIELNLGNLKKMYKFLYSNKERLREL